MVVLLSLIVLWYTKVFIKEPLPKVYFRLARKKSVKVKQLRALECSTVKKCKLRLDEEYFERCMSLNLTPKYLNVKIPKLKCLYNKDAYDVISVQKQLKEIKEEIKKEKLKYEFIYQDIVQNLTLLERCLLMSSIYRHVKQVCTIKIKRQEKKL